MSNDGRAPALRVKRPAKAAAAALIFVAAAAFYWGTAEALLNRWWPAPGTFRPDSLLASAFARVIFYAVVVAALSAVAMPTAFLVRTYLKKKGKPAPRRWRGAVAGAAALASNAGWLALALTQKTEGAKASGFLKADEPTTFFIYWACWAAAAAAALLAGRRFSRPKGRPGVKKLISFAGAAAFVLLVAAHAVTGLFRPVAPGPNVLLITLDAWRADAFRADVMPHMHAFASKRATVYTHVWSCAPWTLPSTAACLTGFYPDTFNSWGQRPGGDHATVAQALRAAGYDTAAFTGNAVLERYVPLMSGFDTFTLWCWNPALAAIRFYETNWHGPAVRDAFRLHARTGPATSRRLIDLATRYVRKPRRRPYFLWVHFMDPHTPYTPPPGFYAAADEYALSRFRPASRARREVNRRLYEGECRYTDTSLQPLWTAATRRGRTVIVFTSDHGEEFWEHRTYGHGESVYDAVTRVPLIVATPGQKPAVDDTPTSLIDLAPTVLAAAGLEPRAAMPGRPLGTGSGAAPRFIFIGSGFTDRPGADFPREDAVIRWPYKFIVRHNEADVSGEYYDLAEDPGEQHPLPEDDGARALRAALKAWREETAPGPGAAADGALPVGPDAADLRALGYIK